MFGNSKEEKTVRTHRHSNSLRALSEVGILWYLRTCIQHQKLRAEGHRRVMRCERRLGHTGDVGVTNSLNLPAGGLGVWGRGEGGQTQKTKTFSPNPTATLYETPSPEQRGRCAVIRSASYASCSPTCDLRIVGLTMLEAISIHKAYPWCRVSRIELRRNELE